MICNFFSILLTSSFRFRWFACFFPSLCWWRKKTSRNRLGVFQTITNDWITTVVFRLYKYITHAQLMSKLSCHYSNISTGNVSIEFHEFKLYKYQMKKLSHIRVINYSRFDSTDFHNFKEFFRVEISFVEWKIRNKFLVHEKYEQWEVSQ